jgi:hypothetical protein
LHVPRRELERKFQIILFAENARIELKSSANERRGANLPIQSVCRTSREKTVEQRVKKEFHVARRELERKKSDSYFL